MAEELKPATTTTEGKPQPEPQTPDSSSQEGVAVEQETPEAPSEEAVAPAATPPEPEAEIVYEFTAPEGHELDPEAMKAFEGIAREVKLAPEAAQKMLESLVPVLQERNAQGIEASVKALRKEWEDTLRADENLGGPHLKETLASANRAIDAYPGGEALRELLDETGLGGNPAFVGFAHWVGKAMAPDTKLVKGAPGGRENLPKDPVQRLAEAYESAAE